MKAILPKLKNWWWYHKNLVLIALAAAAVLMYIVWLNGQSPEPDYHVGLVSTTPFSPEQMEQMEARLCQAGTDVNGDGQVLVQIHSYAADLADDSPNAGYNHYEILAALDGDLVGNVSGIFLLEDPESFQQATNHILADEMILWQENLTLALRTDAQSAYTKLFDAFR